MKTGYDPDKHHRCSIRLDGYDYSQPGAYFITACTHNRECLFGKVVDGVMRLNALGKIVQEEWFKTTEIRPHVALHNNEFALMPNHIHGIVWILDHVGAQRRCAPTPPPTTTIQSINVAPGSLGAIIRSFKSAVTKRVNQMRHTPGMPVWQRNYYEHIIRSEESLNRLRQYLADNPLRWDVDRENPHATGTGDRWEGIFRGDGSPQHVGESGPSGVGTDRVPARDGTTPVGAQRRCAPTYSTRPVLPPEDRP